MAKDSEKNISISVEELVGKLTTQVAALGSAVQKIQQAVQQGGQQVNQQQGAASTLGELVNKVLSSSSRDTDVNAEEAMKSYSPVWGLNGKLIFANELQGLINARDRYDNAAMQIINDQIKNARQWDSQMFSAFGERNTINLKTLTNATGQPGYFHEKAPAEKGTEDEVEG